MPLFRSVKPNSNNYSVDTNQLDEFGWTKSNWVIHRNKANIIFLLLLTSIITILSLIIVSFNNQCLGKSEYISILFGTNILLIGITYKFVWKYTKWTKPKVGESQFTGNSSIIKFQNKITITGDNV
jgi:hypothetical protein